MGGGRKQLPTYIAHSTTNLKNKKNIVPKINFTKP
jgi:hypothetical protein